MAKDDLTLVRVLQLDDRGGDVKALKRMLSRADVNFPRERFDDHFGKKLEAAVKRFQRKHGLIADGVVGYMTFKALVPFADAFASKLLRDFEKERIGDWGLIGRKTAWNGLDMGVDFKGAGPIPMFDDGKIVRIVNTNSGWPGIGGLIVVQCDKGPMSKHPIYVAEDVKIPASHRVGKRLAKGELLAEATGSSWVGIEIGWAGGPPSFRGTRFQEAHGHYSSNPRVTAEGTDFWTTLSKHMAKG